MGKKKNKFGELGINERYVEKPKDQQSNEQPPDVSHTDKSTSKGNFKALVKEKLFPGVVHNSKAPSDNGKFTYKKASYKDEGMGHSESAKLPRGLIKPHFLMMFVMAVLCIFSLASDSGFSVGLSGWKKYVVMILINIMVYIIPVCAYAWLKKLKPKNMYIKLFSPSIIALSVVSLLLMMSLTALEKYYIAYNFSYRITESVPQNAGVIEVLLTNAIIPAVFETVFVNGALQSEYSRYGGGVTGILASSLVFAFVHLDTKLFIIYFTAGLVLGVLTHVSGSVFPAILVHFANNAAALFLSDRMTFIASERIGGTFLMTVLGIFCFIFLLIQLQMIEKNAKSKYVKLTMSTKNPEDYDKSEVAEKLLSDRIHFICPDGATGKRFLRLVFSPAMIAAAVAFICMN